MASTCFCGCGREIKGIRRKANDQVARQMTTHLATLRGALDRGDAGDRADEATVLVDRGTALLQSITAYLHGEGDRGDIDKAGVKTWLRDAERLSKSLVAKASGPAWGPDDPATTQLALSGVRAKGVITDVSRDGWGNERVADVKMTASIEAVDGSSIDVTRSLSIEVMKAPRVGDRIEVAYDPVDPNRFVYRPRID